MACKPRWHALPGWFESQQANVMNRFQNILCVFPGGWPDPSALQRAVALAENNQSRLKVVAIVAPISIGMGMPENGPISAELQASQIKMLQQSIGSVVEPYLKRVKIETGVLVGIQFLEIIREVLRYRHDLVIKVPEPQDWLDRFLGSEDMHLLRKCPCPVWLIKPSVPSPFRRVVAAIDVSHIYPPAEVKSRQSLNQQILEMAMSLALADFAELHIVHAWQAAGESAMRKPMVKKPDLDVDAYVEAVRQDHKANLDEMLQDVAQNMGKEALEFLKPRLHLVKGRARKELPPLTEKLQADVLVMGTVARTGIPGIISGNTAESILNQINCSVLAIKPPGFETPVTLV